MAVKVIGEDPKHIKHTSCKNCASKLEYIQADVQSQYVTDYGGGGDTYYWIICPKCINPVYVSSR